MSGQNKEKFINEVEARLRLMFSASKDGYKASPVDKHRLEGFIQAGVFMGLTSNQEMAEIMDAAHLSVFDKTMAQRRLAMGGSWQEELMDYSGYDQPSYERQRKKNL